MDKARTKLLDFVKTYLKNKDLVFRRIESITDNNEGFFIKYKHKESQFIPELTLDQSTFEKIKKTKNLSIVCLNTKENLNFLKKNWKELSENIGLSFYFSNPFSKTERIWIINPHTHNRIADNESLSLGLDTMFQNVEEISQNEFRKLAE